MSYVPFCVSAVECGTDELSTGGYDRFWTMSRVFFDEDSKPNLAIIAGDS